MSEAYTSRPTESESMPAAERERTDSFRIVAERVANLLNVLEETVRKFPDVVLPNGESRLPETSYEVLLARAQRLVEGLEGYREQVRAQGVYHHERAVAIVEAAVEHITQYLAVRTDLEREAVDRHNAGAKDLGIVLDRAMHELVSGGVADDAAAGASVVYGGASDNVSR